jgi:hypothetical protein
MPTNKGPSDILQKKAASIIASNISRDLDMSVIETVSSLDIAEKVLVDIFKIICEDADNMVREKMCVCYARVSKWLTCRYST